VTQKLSAVTVLQQIAWLSRGGSSSFAVSSSDKRFDQRGCLAVVAQLEEIYQ